MQVEIFCDGACIPNPGHMGIGIVLGDETRTVARYLGLGTNQIAELEALKASLTLAMAGDTIFSDSNYALKVTTGLWRPKIHFDLIEELQQIFKTACATLRWVRGHGGHPLQELADRLAKRAAISRRSEIDSPAGLLSGRGLGESGHD
ncbi:MAG: ribonuclease HI [Deltaproteobacteria bacterium]|nr:ribonuclease HI [Deltaproteobacteria bacterium]